MKLPQVCIDISSGMVAIGDINVRDTLSHMRVEHFSDQNKPVYLGDGLLGAIHASVYVLQKPDVLQVKITPPAGLNFQQSDRRAAEICSAVAKAFSQAPNTFQPRQSWGTVTLLREWRDGGWGAVFDVAQRT